MNSRSPEVLQLADRFFKGIEDNDIDTVSSLYAKDALIWHSYDKIEARTDKALCQSVEDNLALLSALPEIIIDLRYAVWHQETTSTGFIRQHVVHGKTVEGDTLSFPVCVVAEVSDARITKYYEYLDVSQLPPIILKHLA